MITWEILSVHQVFHSTTRVRRRLTRMPFPKKENEHIIKIPDSKKRIGTVS